MRRTLPVGSRCPRLLVGALALLAGGCTMSISTNKNNNAPTGDPLFGLFPGPNPSDPPPPPSTMQAAPLPLPPATQNSGAPASLASQSGGQSLAIPEQGSAATFSSGGRDMGWSLAPNPSPKVVPVPRDNGAAPAATSTASWNSPGSSPATFPAAAAVAPFAPMTALATAGPTSEEMRTRLKERGVVGQKTDPAPGGLQLTCYVARPDNPSAFRVMNVTATDYVAAAQLILQQLDGR